MNRIGRRHGWWLIALAVFALVGGARLAGFLRPLENAAADARARILTREVQSDIVIVGIDAASLATLDEWPWPRRHHGELIDRLSAASPGRVFFDIDFSALSNPLDDALLESALAKPRDFPLVLPTFFQYRSPTDPRFIVVKPRPRFARRTELAAVNRQVGPDGMTRAWRNAWTIDGQRVPSVIDPRRLIADDRDVLIDFSISPSSFTYVSYVDVLEGRVPRETFAGKQVFVGGTAVELNDMPPVPIHGSLPGIVVQALAVETVLAGAPRVLPDWARFALLAGWTLLGAWLLGLRRGARSGPSWRRNLAVFSLLTGVAAGLSVYAFSAHRLWIDAAAPIAAITLLFVVATLRSLDEQTWRALAYSLGMRRRDALLKSIVQSSTDCIVCVDENGIIKTANPAASRLFDCAAHDLVDEPIAKFIALLAGEEADTRLGSLHGLIRECDARTLKGEVFPVEIAVSRVRLFSPVGLKPTSERLYTAIVRDIRERRMQQRRLQYQATHDSLTNLPNRAALLARLEVALGGDAMPPNVVLLMLDLCRFKEVNDTLGHNVGDRILCEVAQRFQTTLGPDGFIARVGGDEFTVVLDGAATDATVTRLSQSLADSLRAPIDVAGISIEVGVSIGIARGAVDAPDAQTLMRHADVAMYVAKRRGTPFEFYDAAHDENTVRRLAIGGELRSAIAAGQLELHFQPQVNLRSGLCESVEALLRWTHPTQGPIGPDEFIAVAESTDLIRPLTEWTLRGALAQIRAWRERGVHVRIAVNLSARILQDIALPARLSELLASAGVSASSLELEITEGAMMLDPARALRVLQAIDRLGVLVSIDDFGTGYSSLGYLRDLPVHALKLDKSFVMGMRSNTDDRIIVESTAQMAHALRLELVAEGVETEWDAQFLAAAGYDFAQGFNFARALPADECFSWIVEYNATAILAVNDLSPAPRERGRLHMEDAPTELRDRSRRG
jgi:diguanylate cyclase (GGDEF)-like protein/PAS domain S-box-containing protein